MTYDWHKRHHADMIELSDRLSLEDEGALTRILDHIHLRGRALVDDHKVIAALLRIHVHTWRSIRKRLLAVGALVIKDGCLDNEHAIKARCERHQRSIKAASAGHRGGIARSTTRNVNGLGEANAKHVLKQNRIEERENPSGSPLEDAYDEARDFDRDVDDNIPF